MVKFLSKLFSSDETVNSVIDGAKSGIDKLFYTEEEKADASQAAFAMHLKYMEATAPYKLARRYVAVIVTLVWAWCTLLGSLFFLYALYNDAALDTLTVLIDYIFKLVIPAFLAVIYFYFKSRPDS